VRQKLFVIIVLLAVGLLGAGLAFGPLQRHQASAADPALLGTLWPEPKPLMDFVLSDDRGQPFGPGQLQGQWDLVFFGYTSCPDICPTTMAILEQMTILMREQGTQAPRVLMVSLDPQRDDVEKLGRYASYFGDNMVGVTGEPQQLDKLVNQIGAMYERGVPDAQGWYDIAHTSSVFVVDPRGRLYAVLSPPHQAAAMVSKLVGIEKHFERE
jgi:protein SCO1/2